MSAMAKGKKKNEELCLIFDITSASVGGALFYTKNSIKSKMTRGELNRTIFSVREPITFSREIDYDKFLSLTLKSLEIVAGKICNARLGAPDKIFCTLFSPWYASQTRTVNFTLGKSFTFTAKLADSLIQKEIKLFEEEVMGYLSDKNDIRLIELKNMQVSLDGKMNNNPLGKRAKELSMTIFISMSQEQVLNKIKETIGRHFHVQKMKFISFAMASFSVTRDIFTKQKDFLLVDVSGEVTDISLVNNDILVDSISFPLGQNYFIREIARVFNCTLDEAKLYLSLYKDKHMLNAMGRKFEPVIDKLKMNWQKSFKKSLENFSNNSIDTNTIFLTIDKNLADFFSEIMKNDSKFKVIILGTQTLHGNVSFEENIARDNFLTLESIYINKIL